MKRIPSFDIDHTKLKKGVYVSRKDKVLWKTLTTFDIRMKTPYMDKPLSARSAHTLEHLAATWLRNSRVQDRVVYFGPMGCLTGFYLILKGNLSPYDIQNVLFDMFLWISNFEGNVPGATEKECGNYLLNDLASAKRDAYQFLKDVICSFNEENTNYPQ